MYPTVKILFTTTQVRFVEKKAFAIATLDLENKTFMIHITSLANINNIYLSHKAQIVFIKIDETFITVFLEYFDFENVFTLELAVELLEHMRINSYAINLIDSK